MTLRVGSYKIYREEVVENQGHNHRYLLKDYGDYKTISKLTNDVVQTKIDEYVYWVNPNLPKE